MVAILQRFDPYEREKILSKTKLFIVDKGQFVYREGDSANHLYFIHSGEVRLYKTVDENKDITVFLRRQQNAFGEIGVFAGKKYSNTAIATKRCKLSVIQKKDILQLMKEDGMIGIKFTKWIAEELEMSKAKIRDYLAFGTEGAIASVFIRYSNMYGVVSSEGISIMEAIKLNDVSKHIGVSRETVSRIVNKWKEKGIISNSNKNYIIKDVEYLNNLLGCYSCSVKNCIL